MFHVIPGYEDVPKPTRATKNSAAFDLYVAEDITIPSILSSQIMLAILRIATSNYQSAMESILTRMTVKSGDDSTLIQDTLELLNLILTLDLDEAKNLIKDNGFKLPLVPTGYAIELEEDEVFDISIRSSVPLSSYLTLANGIGVIDSDYYGNPDNGGHIYLQLLNFSPFNINLKKGDRIAQGQVLKYVKPNDNVTMERIGGHGSTNKEG